MMAMTWVFALIILSACETQQTEANTNSSVPADKYYVYRNSTFNVGSEVNLTCNNKRWNEMFYVIWEITKDTYKECRISHSDRGTSENSCSGGMSLQNTSTSQSYLHISNFSNDDVGVYKCESAYSGGSDDIIIYVTITVPPNISAWFEQKGNTTVAVCKAENGKPAANISWNHKGNSSLKTSSSSDGLITVESHMEHPEKNLICTITHPYWKSRRTLILEPMKDQPAGLQFNLLYILIAVIIIAVLAGFLFFTQKTLPKLRSCRQANTSLSKQAEDVEEVEPYASYVQRVNSIYNS